MSYQPRVRSAIWTTLVLLLVCAPATSSLAARNHADAIARDVELSNAQQQNLAAAPAPTPPVGMSHGAEKQSLRTAIVNVPSSTNRCGNHRR